MYKIYIFCFIILFLFSANLFSQESYKQSSGNYVGITGCYAELPQDEIEECDMGRPGNYFPVFPIIENFRNPNTSVRVIKTTSENLSVFPNFRVHPSAGTQSEVPIVRNPSNHNILLGSANTWRGGNFISEGIYVSTNGGLNWYGNDTINSPLIENGHSGDPAPIIDKDGNMIITHLIFTPYSGIAANYSTNNGITWSQQVFISTHSSGVFDKDFSCTDDVPGSPFYGRCYCAWYHSGNEYISYTSNGGVNWSSQIQINQSNSSFGIDICSGTNGQVYAAWSSDNNNCSIGISTDGASTWNVNETAFSANGSLYYLPTKGNILVNGLPRIACDKSQSSRRGWIYIAAAYKNLFPAGSDPDIILHRSTDGGLTWSEGIRVNRDKLNNGSVQYLPAICVDDSGGVNIVYYDDRDIGGNQVQVYLSRSIDGGNTWNDIQITDHNFTPSVINGYNSGNYQGDYIGVTSAGSSIIPLWMDNFSGIYQAWSAIININVIGISSNNNQIPSSYSLMQNYPNPFNPSTTIEYNVPKTGLVLFSVTDIQGHELYRLDEFRNPGTYKINFDGTNFPSGVYFYRIEADDFSETRKMILIK